MREILINQGCNLKNSQMGPKLKNKQAQKVFLKFQVFEPKNS